MTTFKYFIAITFFSGTVFLTPGCGTVDATRGHTGSLPMCEIHHCQMAAEFIYVGGEIIYLGGYWDTCRKNFPHHGGHRYNCESESTPYDRDVIDFVCPECDKLYFQYWKAKRKVQEENDFTNDENSVNAQQNTTADGNE